MALSRIVSTGIKDHVEVYLTYLIPELYWRYGSIICVITYQGPYLVAWLTATRGVCDKGNLENQSSTATRELHEPLLQSPS